MFRKQEARIVALAAAILAVLALRHPDPLALAGTILRGTTAF